ncbi:MAG: proprotein convertase P-domain-containing protein [Saprospiraceae bacterium]
MKGLIKCTWTGILLFGISWMAIGQPFPTQFNTHSLIQLPPLDNESLKKKEVQRRIAHLPPHFATKRSVNLEPSSHGQWESGSKDTMIWSLKVQSPGAFSLNLGFSEFTLPDQAQFYLHAPGNGQTIGPLTTNDNESHNQFFSPALEGDALVLILKILKSQIPNLKLQLSSINHDFIGLSNLLQSSECQIDIACDEAESYRDIAQSVGLIAIDGVGICTGFLVNNTAEDCRPYFITAHHCDINSQNAPSVVVYWNYANSYCRVESETGDGSLATFNSGANWIASYQPSDFCLLELDDPVHPDANAYFAGWNRTSQPPQNLTFSIHHPDGSEKSLALNTDGTEIINYEFGDYPDQNGNHLMVANWELGTTEYGSSGAPLLDENQLVVGQLHGGLASCDNNDYDAFGWWFKSWEGGGTPSSALKFWLDPIQRGNWTLDGQFEKDCGYHFIEILETPNSLCGRDTLYIEFQLGPEFKISTSLSITNLPNGFNYFFLPSSAVGGEVIRLFIFPEGEPLSQQVNFNLLAENNQISSRLSLGFDYAPSLSQPPTLNPVVDGEIAPLLSWEPYEAHLLWQLEIVNDTGLWIDTILSSNQFQSPILSSNTIYECRVRGINACGNSVWSEVASWVTPDISCQEYERAFTDPESIPDNNQGIFEDSIKVENIGNLLAVRLNRLVINHSFIGDLTAWLQSPSGTKVLLFDQAGADGSGFGCPGENLDVSLDDFAAANYMDFTNTCTNTSPAISGNFQPKEPLNQLLGENPMGYWKLLIEDQTSEDIGSVESWSLEVCTAPKATSYNPLYTKQADIGLFPNPTRGWTSIKDWPINEELQLVHIYAIDGKLIQTITMEHNQRALHLSNLRNGTYIFQIQGKKIVVYRKIILHR